MSRRSRSASFGAVLFLASVVATCAFLVSQSTPAPATAQSRPNRKNLRNLFLQPEALQVGRRLGKRFGHSTSGSSVMVGTLAISGSEQVVTLTRRQTDAGEQVDLLAGNRSLTWNDREGTNALAGAASDTERLLLERLTLDSPDQFVLAQLRGASYFTIARNVRPADAGDDYAGALWNLVRVDEPQTNDEVRPLSPWRIYYLNVNTGLPDRIEYQLNGQPITAEFLEWIEQQGEKTPSRVRWSSNGQTLMEFRVTSVSYIQ